MSESLTSKTLHGLKWSYVSTVVNAALQICFTALLARLLEPSAFGLLAMGGAILRFGSYFSQMGIGPGLIQKKDITKEEISAAFTSSVLLGILSFIVLWFCAPLATYVFYSVEVVGIIKVMALSLVLTSLAATPLSLLRRNLQFRAIAIVEIVSFLLGYGALGLALAYNGFGVWSLVLASLAQNALYAALAYSFARHSLAITYEWRYFEKLFSFGSRFSVVSFVESVSVSLDTLLIGHFSGPGPLGFYNRAYMIVYLPMSYLSTTFSRVLFASYSRIQTDLDRLRSAYLSSITLSAAVVAPICGGIVVCAHDIVFVLLGEKWLEVVPLVQILSIGVTALMLSQLGGIVCDATARLSAKLLIQIAHVCIIASLLYIFRPFGLIGFAAAITLGELIRNVGFAYLMNKILKVDYRQILSAYYPGLIVALMIGAVLFLATLILGATSAQTWTKLVVELVIGIVLLYFFTFLVPQETLKSEIRKAIVQSGILEGGFKPFLWILHKSFHTVGVQVAADLNKGAER